MNSGSTSRGAEVHRLRVACGALIAFLAASQTPAGAETIQQAMARAYVKSSSLRADEAAGHAVGHNLEIAAAGFGPTVKGFADVGAGYNTSLSAGRPANSLPRGYGVTINQPIWDGGRTAGAVAQATAQIDLAAEVVRDKTQTLLFNAAAAFMSMKRDTAVVRLRTDHVAACYLLLNHTTKREAIGELTKADAAQVRTAYLQARSDLLTAEAGLEATIVRYTAVIGKVPSHFEPARSPEHLVPRSRDELMKVSLRQHPALRAAEAAVQMSSAGVKVTESLFLPSIGLTAAVGQRFETPEHPGGQNATASVVATLSVPVYEGRAPSATVSRSKDLLQEAALRLDAERERVRADVSIAWSSWRRVQPNYEWVQDQVASAQVALVHVRAEADLGSRTTQDILNAQAALLSARLKLLEAQYERVMSGYVVLRAAGILDAPRVGALGIATRQ